MKQSTSLLSTLSKRSFRANKGRNLVAAIAIILTTLMFTTLFVLSQSMSQNLIEMTFRQSGFDAHASFKSITDAQIELIGEHSDVADIGRSIVLGVAENTALTGRQVEIRYGSTSYAEHSFSMPTTGKLPEQANEIALDNITLDRLGIEHKLGQQVTLEWRKDYSSDERISSTFTLCGFWEGNLSSYASMAWVSETFALEACDYAPNNAADSICGMRMAQVTLENGNDIEATVDKILADVGLSDLEYGVNIAYDPSMQAVATQESLPMYLGMILVFIAGYLIIYNIFQISVTTDIQFYGKLKTLGTSTKQVKRLIFKQANMLSLIGIPIGLILGYLLGKILVPVLIANNDGSVSTSISPIIFIGSALFAYLTVMISCLRPAIIAGKVSPMEALRYSDNSSNGKRKTKKGEDGASIARMAWANLGRNKKRTVLVICSITLGLVLLSCFYAQNASFDMDKYLSDLTLADFQVDDATSDDYINGYDPQSKTISPALVEQVESLEGLEETGRLYSQETTITLSEQAIQNTQNFYERDDRLSYMQEDVSWMEGYHAALETGSVDSVIYGTDGLTIELLGDSRYLMDGSFDPELFATGDYVMAVGVAHDDFSETMPTFSVGETVVIEGNEYTVMGVVYPITPLTSGSSSFSYYNNLIMPTDEFQQIWPDSNMRKLYFNISDDLVEAATAMLTEYQQQEDSSMPFASRQTMEEQYVAETRASAVMGNTISIVIALVGIINFINSMVTAIVSRKREFAMLQSVGMTKSQLCRMLVFEGLDYAAFSLVLSYILGSMAILTVVRAMVEGGFTTFQFTLMPLIVCTPILIIFASLIPYICFKNLEKKSLVERLRNTD